MNNEVTVWIRSEVLDLGILPIISSDKLSLDMLSKLLIYAKDMGEGGYPKMIYDTWQYIAVRKMGICEESCWMIFTMCRLFSQIEPEYCRNLDLELALLSTDLQKNELWSESYVWTLELVLFLYLQRFIDVHPKSVARRNSLTNLTTDPWPGASLNVSQYKQLPEEQYMLFIRESLSEILSLMAGHIIIDDPEKRRSGHFEKKSARELLGFMKSAGVLMPDVVKALKFIIGCNYEGEMQERDLFCVAVDRNISYKSGYLIKKKSFQKGLFEKWLLQCLDWAPNGDWMCLRLGQKVRWPIVSQALRPLHRLIKSPRPCVNRLLYICDLSDGMAAHTDDDIALFNLKIWRCTKSTIYILQPLKNVTIHKCHECKIILGPVKGCIKVNGSINTTLSCPARSVVVSDCRSVTVYTMTPQPPLVIGLRSRGIVLAPLNFYYPKLKLHLTTAGLDKVSSSWNKPVHLNTVGVLNDSCELMQPEEFNLIVIPFLNFKNDGRPPLLPSGLPHEYAKSIEEKQQYVCSFREEVEEANLTEEQKVALQKMIDARFKCWLKETGKQKELDLLEKLSSLIKYERMSKSTAI